MYRAGSSNKPISSIKLSWYMVLVMVALYRLLFTLINWQYSLLGFLIGIAFDAILLSLMVWLGYGLSTIIDKLPILPEKSPLRYIVEFVCLLWMNYWLLTSVYYFLMVKANNITGDWQDWRYRFFIGINLVVAANIYLLQSGLNLYRITQQKIAESEKVQKEFAQVRLQALHNQLNPHFLFNSLSVLSSMVHIDAELSEKFIVQLSVAYRYILEGKDMEWVKLSSEIEFLEAYFFLLQIRFEQKIKLHKQIELDTEAYKLPPLTLQLLVENAVKHNKMSSNVPLEICLYNSGERLIIENNINLRVQLEQSTGIGLDNIKKRYGYLTRQVVEVTHTGSHFKVSIPLLRIY